MTQTFYPSVSSNETIHFYSSNTAITNSLKLYNNVGNIYTTNEQLSSYLSTYYSSSTLPNSLFSPFINDVLEYKSIKKYESAYLTSVSEEKSTTTLPDFHTNFPQFITNWNIIKIPSKIEYTVKRFIPKPLLRRINPNLDTAIEMCLLLVSQLSSTHFGINDGSNPKGWKSLKAEYLRDLLSTHPMAYKMAINALKTELQYGPVLESDDNYKIGSKCYNYRLGDPFRSKGIVSYSLKTKEAQELWHRSLSRSFSSALENPISKNLMELYTKITLPSIDEIKIEAKALIKNGFKTKKGKKLISLNKRNREKINNRKSLSFVEDGISLFRFLTDNGLMIPKVGKETSGGRVVDSFSLMPSWIRNLVKIDGEPIIECDYSCLHPNIAMHFYGGLKEFLTHQDITDKIDLDIKVVKKEHLSFFNKHPEHMKNSPLYSHYLINEPKMMANIISQKYNSEHKHKTTSRKMFKKEVEIMTEVVKQLNRDGIYVGYIYDALFCHPRHAAHVKRVMDEIVIKHGVKTSAKISESRNKIISKKITPEKTVELQTTGTNLFL